MRLDSLRLSAGAHLEPQCSTFDCQRRIRSVVGRRCHYLWHRTQETQNSQTHPPQTVPSFQPWVFRGPCVVITDSSWTNVIPHASCWLEPRIVGCSLREISQMVDLEAHNNSGFDTDSRFIRSFRLVAQYCSCKSHSSMFCMCLDYGLDKRFEE